MALPLAGLPEEGPFTKSIRNLRGRKVAVAGMIPFGLHNRRSDAHILCSSLAIPLLASFLALSSNHIFALSLCFCPSR